MTAPLLVLLLIAQMLSRSPAIAAGVPTVCEGPPSSALTCDVPSGSFVLARAFALGTRPTKGPLEADSGFVKLGQDLHLSTFFARDPGPTVTFSTTVAVTSWRVVLVPFDGVGAADPIYGGAPRCSSGGDPACGGGPGTPGKLKAPSLEAPDGALVVGTWISHDNGGAILLPSGYTDEDDVEFDETTLWHSGYAPGPSDGPATAKTALPDFVRGIATRVVLFS